MVLLELFAGTCSVSKVARERGHKAFTIDWSEKFDVDLHADISKLTVEEIIELCGGVRPDVVWASPDCTTFSVAAISHHRRKGTGTLEPISEYARFCDDCDQHVLELIKELNPKVWFIENPRGGFRSMSWMKPYEKFRHTVTYCQYGDSRQKPTDIWCNIPDPKFKPPCKPGAPCHEAAPRGSISGTQKLRNSTVRSIIPRQLCEHIIDICEQEVKDNAE